MKLKKLTLALLANLLLILLVFSVIPQVLAATTYTITSFGFSLSSSTLAPGQTDASFAGALICSSGGYSYYVPSGLNVQLQVSTASTGPWSTVTTTTIFTNPQGYPVYNGTFTTPSIPGTYYYRGYFPTQTKGSDIYSESASTPWTVTVYYQTTTQLNTITNTLLYTGQSNLPYSGQVTATPNVPNGAPVKMQYYRSSDYTWYDITSIATTNNNNGQYSGTFSAQFPYGTIRIRASFPQYNTGGIWRSSTSSEQQVQVGYGLITATITPNEFHSGTNKQYTLKVTNLASNPSDRDIGMIKIAIPTGYIVTSATVNAQSKIWNTPTISAGIITTVSSSESNNLLPGQYIDITFTPTTSPTSETTYTWTTSAWKRSNYDHPFVTSGSQPYTTLVTPTVQSTTILGATKNQFNPTETIYATGTHFNGADTVDIYVTIHQDTWSTNNPLVDRSGARETTTTTSGELAPIALWSNPTPGLYDIVVDANQNGLFDNGDVVDNLDVTVGGTGGLFVVSEYALGGLAALGACFVGFVVVKKRNSLPHLN